MDNISDVLKNKRYVGRGIAVGKSEDGKKACAAYFITGRSANSRNRVFLLKDGVLYTEPYDPSKVEDPSLIIYPAVKRINDNLIVTNGDQTDTIYEAIKNGRCIMSALKTRTFEPDAPNYTPRISAVLDLNEDFSYKMSILKAASDKKACERFLFTYEGVNGVGHFLRTYLDDGNPLPSYQGEPKEIRIPSSIDEFTDEVWNALDEENRISLYVVYVDLSTGEEEIRIVNKNK